MSKLNVIFVVSYYFALVAYFFNNNCQTCVTDNFGFKQEERFACGAKAVDVYPGQRRFPQPLFWDYKVSLI